MGSYRNEEFATSSLKVADIKAGKEELRARDYPLEETRAFVRRFFDAEKFAHLANERVQRFYLVAPSTSGTNIVPQLLAHELKNAFGGEIVEGWALPTNVGRTALKAGLRKLREPPLYVGVPEVLSKIPRFGKLVLVDDVVTTGGTVRALREILAENGRGIGEVLSLGQSELRKVSERDIERITEKLDPGIQSAVQAVLRGQLKHAANDIERILTNANTSARLEIRSYFATEFARLQRLGLAHDRAADGTADRTRSAEGAQRRTDLGAGVSDRVQAEDRSLRGGGDGAAREGVKPTVALVATLRNFREQWEAAAPGQRAALLKEVDRLLADVGGSGVTGVPLRVSAKEFVQGREHVSKLLQRAKDHQKVLDLRRYIGLKQERGSHGLER